VIARDLGPRDPIVVKRIRASARMRNPIHIGKVESPEDGPQPEAREPLVDEAVYGDDLRAGE